MSRPGIGREMQDTSSSQAVLPTGDLDGGDAAACPTRVLIAVDATKDLSDVCLVYALEQIAQPGAKIVFLGIVHTIDTPMGYKSQADPSCFIGTNRKALKIELQKKMDLFEQSLRPLSDLCDQKQVYLDITIRAGTPIKSVVLEEALKLKVTHVVLDRYLRRDRRYYKSHLDCNIYTFSHQNKLEIVKRGNGPGGHGILAGIADKLQVQVIPLAEDDSNLRFSQLVLAENKKASAEGPTFDGMEANSVDSSNLLGSYRLMESRSGEYMSKNSFIDLYVLNSPEGVRSVWGFSNDNESVTSSTSGLANSMDFSISSRDLSNSNLSSSPVSSIFSSVEEKSSMPFPHVGIVAVQPRRRFPILTELLQAHDDRYTQASEEFGSENAIDPRACSISNWKEAACEHVALDATRATQMAGEYTQEGFRNMPFSGKTMLQPPPLCSVCSLISPELGKSPVVFSYEELRAATNDFSTENLIAEGGFGIVFKGILQGGHTIAVKKLKSASLQSNVQFGAEVEALSCAQHRNVVRLIGYYIEFSELALVYEYVCNGSLNHHLSGNSEHTLKWSSRYKIAIGAARGLRYLHEECRIGCIVHRDMRPSNILLTHDFTPMVGDFGLAKFNLSDDSAVETQVIGALGYVAPEYVECGQVTAKTDVYSFGVVLLELISGCKAIDLLRPRGETSLTEWARPKLNRLHFHELVDNRIRSSVDDGELVRMVKAAAICIKKDPLKRPSMSQVLRILEGEVDDFWGTTEEPEMRPMIHPLIKTHDGQEREERMHKVHNLHSTNWRNQTVSKSWRNRVKTA